MITLPKINNQDPRRPKILIAPLDWGLGHATRCIPIIKELLANTCSVWIAASGDQKTLLEEEFPFLPFVEIPGYGIKYGKNRASTLFKLLVAIPKILIRIKREKEWLKSFIALEKPDAIISDNRYGLHAPGIYSVFITHQLGIKTSFGKMADGILRRIHYRMISRFSRCWVPDFEGSQVENFEGQGSLAGDLSHPGRLPSVPTRYIGPLSRFEMPLRKDGIGISGADDNTSCDLLILLSGPEPQRTIFENLLLEQLAIYKGSTILVRGLPGSGHAAIAEAQVRPGEAQTESGGIRTGSGVTPVPPGIQVYNHLPAIRLNAVMAGAGIVLSRAGYSTVMDLVKLGKKAILVPTPGQTEQEYLGKYLTGKKWALGLRQSGFSLPDALAKAGSFPFAMAEGNGGALLKTEMRSLLRIIG